MANRRPLARVSGRTCQLPAGDQLDSAVLANAIAVVLTGLVSSDKSTVAPTDTVLQAIGKLQAQATRRLTAEHVGTAPNQISAVTHLGALAFVDQVGATMVLRHTPASSPGHWWREYISNTQTAIKFHGFDDIVRTISEAGSPGDKGDSGWSPVFSAEADGATRTVLRLLDWIGGSGTKPATLGFIGSTGIVATAAQAVSIKGAQGEAGVFDSGQVGAAPNQLPAGTHLGAMAYMDEAGATMVFLHSPDQPKNAVWRERVSDTETTLKYMGSDGVIRSRQELWT